MSELVVVGKLGAAYGIRGWLKIHSFTGDPEQVFSYQPWQIGKDGNWRDIAVAQWRRHNEGLIVRFAGVEDRTSAETYVGLDVAVAAELLPPLPEGEYYWRDLIGMQVVTESGFALGVVNGLMETGSNDVLAVTAPANDPFGKRERLIPFLLDQVIKQVDLAHKTITVDWDPDF